MLYGASGYTGRLIAEEAVRRGHRPVLAGRSREKLAPVAEPLGLEVAVMGLEDIRGLVASLEGLPLVLHAAGPFVRTSEPMVQACLAAGAHYLDITGEIPVFENAFHHDAEARARGITLMPGVGFDVVPTDCLARYVAERVPGAHELDIAITTSGQASAGTTKSALEQLPSGGRVRRGGTLQLWPLGKGQRRVRFSDAERTVIPIPWGDLVTAWHTTGIPNITTYMALPRAAARFLRVTYPLLKRVMAVDAVRHGAERLIESRMHGPDATARSESRSHLWAEARAADGRRSQAWLDLPEGYAFTAVSAVRAVEEVLAQKPVGTQTPARAFGADFVLTIPGCQRQEVQS
ncbi:integral membrane protein (Rhomboid family) [Hyalangium minutum]|uniref:Integral membrane protein (Rhomboid family) n=2 Tax=Hyalangium minutum TaxID=394096 RepID=A0A085WL27_9BACT|nr:integral membrane protein (Rhomboid family) [Hyalangium minutum]